MTEVTVELLQEARAIAENVGAVEDGSHFFEDAEGRKLYEKDAKRDPESVCGVCVLGAVIMAAQAAGLPTRDEDEYALGARLAWEVAWDVVGWRDPEILTHRITEGGTPYVLAVIDRMIERLGGKVEEREPELVGA